MKIGDVDLSKDQLAQIAIAIRNSSPPSKGRYTELVESLDKRLANIERMIANIIDVMPLPGGAVKTPAESSGKISKEPQ